LRHAAQRIIRSKTATLCHAAAISALFIGWNIPHEAHAASWTQCATEDGTCRLSGSNQVRYGLNDKFVSKTMNGPVKCNNATFGDPYPGVDKVCQYMPASASSPAPAPTPTPAPATTWTKCADEGATCVVPGTAQVRYGAGSSFTTKTVTTSIGCNNTTFGDPAYGVAKACYYSGASGTTSPTTPAPTPAPTTNGLVTDAIFSPTSFWYKQIPANVTLNANSANYVKEFLRQKSAYYGTVTINTYSYASPLYVAAAGEQTKTVKVWDCQGKGYADSNLAAQWTAVPIPANAQPSTGTDGEMTVYQPNSNSLWEFWQTKNVNGQWQACWGGKMSNVSNGNGLWPSPYGTTATGLPFVGGQVTADELKRGEIRHVIGIALVDLEKSGVFSWPATRSDGFRLDPTVNVDALNMSAAGKVIAKAAQKYGFVVWDKAGAISIRAQNATSYIAQGKSDPYPALFANKAEYAVLDGFPWDKLQFLPKDFGKQ
jgi:hypothetical protein